MGNTGRRVCDKLLNESLRGKFPGMPGGVIPQVILKRKHLSGMPFDMFYLFFPSTPPPI